MKPFVIQKFFSSTTHCLLVSALCAATAMADEPPPVAIPEIVVTADFRNTDLMSIGSSISIIQSDVISRRDAQHMDAILTVAPNVNFSAGASRGRFVQVRGIGERSQFKDPLDSSVGLIVDGVDLSGIGLAGGLLDVQQIEVLRGPQGTHFGASALAGAINIQSNKPSEEFEGSVHVGIGNYGKQDWGGMLSGPLIKGRLLGRLSYQQNNADGYIDNDFLDRDDTNNIDEQLARVSLRWLASEDLTIDLAAFFVDADNGYNAFSSFNIRDIPVDDPGHDRQETTSLSTEILWEGFSAFQLEADIFYEKSDLEYGFDWDWGNFPELGYRGSENNLRDRESSGADIRLISNQESTFFGASWVAGLYWYDREVSLDAISGDNFGGFSSFTSQTDTQRLAAYGELEWQLTQQLALIVGGRWEQYELDYADSVSVTENSDEDLWGGKIALEYQLDDRTLLYTSISRGYKGGGMNGQALGKALSDPSTPADIASFLLARSTFESETLVNYEMGVKGWYLDRSLSLSAAAFYMDREDMQAKASVLFPPVEWRDYIENLDGGDNYGLELEANWQLQEALNVFASVGLLETELGNLVVEDLDAGGELNQKGRDQAHAPGYQFNVGVAYDFMRYFTFTLEMDGKDAFYFSNSHNEKSSSYELIHSSLSYTANAVTLTLWGRNLTDEDYQLRGFYFNNTPPNYGGNDVYYQFGEPRIYGVTAKYDF